VDANANIYAAGVTTNSGLNGSTTTNPPPFFPVFNALQPVAGMMAPNSPCPSCTISDGFVLEIAPTNAAAAALTPALLTFPAQPVGTTSAAQTVTIFDMGSAALTVSNVTVTADYAIQNNCGSVAPAGGSCTIQVTYTPTASGPQNGTLTVTDSSAGSPRTVQLIGSGSQGSATPSPSSLSFASQPVGTTSSAQTITLTNGGTLAVEIAHIQVSGPFDESNTCGTSVAAGGSCTISVTFSPTTAGAASGSITFTDSAANSPQSVTLTGTGTGVNPSLGLGVASGASSSASVKAGNSATYMLSIGGAGISGTASLSCTGAPTGATCSVPSTVSVTGASASSFSVSVTTTANSQEWLRPFRLTPWPWALAILGCLVLFEVVVAERHRRPRLRWVPLLAIVLCACGGGGSTAPSTNPNPPTSPSGTKAGNYTLTVKATVGSTTQTQNLTLTVQ
jgi:Abnormal spindle-like microcephaly-assoc'd, ASPM-SPD-2-Hydin